MKTGRQRIPREACPICGKPVNKPRAKYCSLKCSARGKYNPPAKCEVCGAACATPQNRFCSSACNAKANNPQPTGSRYEEKAKSWIVTTPDDEEIEVFDLHAFCRENEHLFAVPKTSMPTWKKAFFGLMQVVNVERVGSWFGWRCRRAEDDL